MLESDLQYREFILSWLTPFGNFRLGCKRRHQLVHYGIVTGYGTAANPCIRLVKPHRLMVESAVYLPRRFHQRHATTDVPLVLVLYRDGQMVVA